MINWKKEVMTNIMQADFIANVSLIVLTYT